MMDPNATLKALRAAIQDHEDSEGDSECDVYEIVELFEALDEWMSKGGFTPDAWAVRGR